ncbi:unnamed protein product [Ectocarpus sp. 6 AP-2014]
MTMGKSGVALLALATGSVMVGAANLRQNEMVVQHATSASPPTRSHASRHLYDSDTSKYEYIGCFTDSQEDRILDDMLTSRYDMSAEKCYEHCMEMGAEYMATQWAQECFCSNNKDLEYDRHGSGAKCDMTCTGVEGEMCGGNHAFDLYKVGGSTDNSPSPSPSPSPDDMAGLLDLHNEARCVHSADPLGWSDPVTSSAAEHAVRLTDQCTSSLFHSTREERYGYGENLFACWGTDTCYSHDYAMENLYVEEVQFDDVTDYIGHATQILWKSTKNVGCVLAGCSNGGTPYTFLVCQYDPAGNMGGDDEYRQEVGLPDPNNSC